MAEHVEQTDSDSESTSQTASGGTPVETAERFQSRRLPLNETFEVLRNQRRRYVLRYLQSADGEVSLGELAEQIAAWENDKEVWEITSSERKCVYVGLYQCHLPKMDGMDVVSFNKPRGLIERGPTAGDVEMYLDREESQDRPAQLGLAVAPAMGALTLGPTAAVWLGQSLPSVIAAAVVVVVAAVAGLGYLLRGAPEQEEAPG